MDNLHDKLVMNIHLCTTHPVCVCEYVYVCYLCTVGRAHTAGHHCCSERVRSVCVYRDDGVSGCPQRSYDCDGLMDGGSEKRRDEGMEV